MDRAEIKKYLKSKGFGSTSIEYILDAISEREAIENARNSEEVKRNKDIMEFKPNPWKTDKEFTDIPDDKFPGKGRIKRILAYTENDRNNTKVQMPEEVITWFEARGIDVNTLLRFEPLLKKYENLSGEEEELKERFDELKDFEPNPGKATLTQVGETKTYLGGNNRGLPIYQEDVDMIKKTQPLAKKLVEVQNEKQALRNLNDIIDEVRNIKPEELNVGPDTTENIHEISDNYPGDKHGEEQVRDSSDVMFGVDIETQGLRGNTEVMFRREEDLVDLQHNTRGMETIDDKMYPSKEDADKAMEECNKNVSDPGDYYRYSTIFKRMGDTHTRKNNDYGDAAYQGYKKYGPAYFLVQLHNKLSRLESLTINNKSQMVKDESIDDTLLDMANYAVMYLESRHRDD